MPAPSTIGGDCSLSPQKPGDSPPLGGPLIGREQKRDDHCLLRRRPVKRFVCAELYPGCDRVVTGPTDQVVLDRVLAHAAGDHDLTRPSMTFIERVVIATRPVTPERGQQRGLALIGAAPPDRPGTITVAGHRPGRRLRPGERIGPAATGPAATVTALADRPARSHRTYRHECWLYDGDAEFVAAMVPFIRDGLARKQPVMVAVPQPRLHALRDALGGDAENVAWADMADLGANPARIIPAWQEFTEKYCGDRRPVRGIGQPIWPGRGDAELVEAQFHEALLNLAVPPDTPLWLLCPYDTSTLPDSVIDEALRSHPVLAQAGAYRGSTQYGGVHHAERPVRRPAPRTRRADHRGRLRPGPTPARRPAHPVRCDRGRDRGPGRDIRRRGRRDRRHRAPRRRPCPDPAVARP